MKEIRYGKVNKSLIAGIILALLAVLPVAAGLFVLPYDVNAMNPSEMFAAPSLKHLFGTDNFGRDIYSRVMDGAATTFLISLATVTAGAAIGTLVGAFTGYYGGPLDEILMRVNDCLASFPSILLALVVVSVLNAGTLNICIALGLVFIPSFARIMRSAFLEERDRDYVLSAKLMGASDLRIMFIHIFPNTIRILLSAVLVGLNNAVLAEAGLSYLGLGVQPPDPSLGRMLAEGQSYLLRAPWYEIFTCAMIVTVIVGLSMIAENIGVSGVNLYAVKRKLDRLRRETDATEADAGPAGCTGKSSDGVRNENVTGRSSAPKLIVDKLSVSFADDNGLSETLHDISFEVSNGEILGIVGESGSGKSLTAQAVMGILPERACVTAGRILLKDEPPFAEENTESASPTEGISGRKGSAGYFAGGYRNLPDMKEKELCGIRGKRIAMIFQEPMTSLNPTQTVGEQIDEVLDLHMSLLTAGEQRQLVLAAMRDAGLSGESDLYNKYPHELSGGMRQRVVIAMALVAGAEVMIADEPTTALDEAVAGEIITTFGNINRKYGTTIIFISHDLKVVSRLCSRILVMRRGRIEESLEVADGSFDKPSTEYGKELLAAAFSDRSFVDAPVSDDGIKNHIYCSAIDGNASADDPDEKDGIVVKLNHFSTFYPEQKIGFGRKKYKKINSDITFSVNRGECYGLIGSSGCGKTTLVKGIAGLLKKTEGEAVLPCGIPGMVFQDPYGSLNPAWTVRRILREAVILREKRAGISTKVPSKETIDKESADIMAAVGLEKEILTRKTSGLSGGQRQRVAIAANLLLKPNLIILDEPLSAVDVTLREQLLELLFELKAKYSLTYILISHDSTLVARTCARVMRLDAQK